MANETSVKVAAYSRVSTLLGQDINHQLVPIRQMAIARGFDVIAEYSDEGISGTKMRRPGLDRLVRDAKLGKFKLLIIYALDRIGRDVKGTLDLFCELNEVGVSVISLRESIDFSTSIGRATMTILAAVAELEVSLVSERIKTALAVKRLAAKESGSNWRSGRPSVMTPEITLKVLELREAKLSIRQIEKALDRKISRASIERILRAHSERVKKYPSKVP